MRVLGLSCYYHDAAAVLLVDGNLIAAAEEERFSRKKHDHSFPRNAIEFCLRTGGIGKEDLDLVVFYEKPFWKLDRILMSVLQTYPRSLHAFRDSMLVWLLDKLWVRDTISDYLGCGRDKIAFCQHHLSHAASAFYCSAFDQAAVLTVDGVGEWASATSGTAAGSRIRLQEKMSYPHSLGLLYSAFTAFLGFDVNEGEYKVMGMAPYGKPRFFDLILEKLVELHDDGSFWLDMDYFAFHYSTTSSFSEKFCTLFGTPRSRAESHLLDPHYADVAASIQKVTEHILLAQARHLQQKTGLENLVMAGGVALNSVANYRILTESGFRRLFIQPAAGDSGGALGAALWGSHEVLGEPRRLHLQHCAWGEEHSPGAIRDFLRSQQIEHRELADEDAVAEEVARRLASSQVVGWMQGRFEWGPRALGQRSILADPRDARTKELVNASIKFREPFRPFAPAVIAERAAEFFSLENPQEVDPARYMLLVVPVPEARRSQMQATTHEDGSARVQVVHRDATPLYHRLIQRFGEQSGVPVVLNTSFNLRGEPIVNTPAEAYSTFHRSDMDALVMGNFLVSRREVHEQRVFPAGGFEPAPQPPPPPPQHKESPLPGVAVAVLCILLVLEGFLRLWLPNPNLQVRGMYRQEPGGISLQPGWKRRVHTHEFKVDIAINKQGLRDPQDGPQASMKHLMVLGDSFVFGCWSAVDKTWLGLLSQKLPGTQVIRAGNPNFGTDAELNFLRQHGDELHPDMLLLAFYNGNDFYDNMVGCDSYTLEDGYLVMKDVDHTRWSQYNCLAEAAAPDAETVPPFKPLLPASAPSTSVRATFLLSSLRHTYLYQTGAALGHAFFTPSKEIRPFEAESWFLKKYSVDMQNAVDHTYGYLDAILEDTRRRHIPLVLVDIPAASQIYDDDWNRWLQRHKGVDPALLDRDKPHRLVAAWAQARGVPLLDLAPALKSGPRAYYFRDMHWNDTGHQLAGERVVTFLRENHLVP